MPSKEPLKNNEGANALFKALARAGRKREKQQGWVKNSRGIYSVLTEYPITQLVEIIDKNLDKIGYKIVRKDAV